MFLKKIMKVIKIELYVKISKSSISIEYRLIQNSIYSNLKFFIKKSVIKITSKGFIKQQDIIFKILARYLIETKVGI